MISAPISSPKRVAAFIKLKLRKLSGRGKDDQEEPKVSQAIFSGI